MKARQVARLYNLARGRGGENEQSDIEALTKLIEEVLKQNDKHIREYYLVKHPETANLKHDDVCGCFLCYLEQTD